MPDPEGAEAGGGYLQGPGEPADEGSGDPSADVHHLRRVRESDGQLLGRLHDLGRRIRQAAGE